MKLGAIGWSAAGLALPVAAALLCIPPLLRLLGAERFGLLSLAWALTAAAGMFDLGIGRAATRLGAMHVERADLGSLRELRRVAERLAWLAGAAGAALLALAVGLGLTDLLKATAVPQDELRWAGVLLALNIPLQASIAVHRGLGEAQRRFRSVSLARMGIGAAHFVAPLAVALVTSSLVWLVGTLVLTRGLAWFAFRVISEVGPADGSSAPAAPGHGHNPELTRTLLKAGGWFTVSGIVSPLLVQSDRFFIASVVSVAAVSAYVIPFELVTQLAIATSAISTVAFPSLAGLLQRDRASAWASFTRWLGVTTALMLVICAAMALALPHLLPLWIGPSLPPESVRIGQWLCLGIFVNSVGIMYFAYLHADGRFRDTAILHLVELPLYVAVLLLCLSTFGTVGAAIAWVIRVCADTGTLAILCHRSRAHPLPVRAAA